MLNGPSRGEMPRAYEPGEVEQQIYRFWNESGFFTPRSTAPRLRSSSLCPRPTSQGSFTWVTR